MTRFLLLITLSIALLTFWHGSVAAAPANDNFANAVSISTLPYSNSHSTAGATTEAGEPSPCGGIAATVWYTYTPAENETVAIDTSSSDYDTVLAAYSGSSLGSLSLIACNDDYQGLQSLLIVALTAGNTYYFQAGGFFGATGSLAMNLSTFTTPNEATPVTIDIKPEGTPNSINLSSNGVLPVAILAADGFDPSTVDPATVSFDTAPPVHFAMEDVDDDGDLDLILHFLTQETGIKSTDTEACLTGQTYGAEEIEGCDTVRIVPPSSDGDLDSFADDVEATLGTHQFFYCSKAGVYLAWPPDLNGDARVTASDVFSIFPGWLKRLGDEGFKPRHDLNIDTVISGADVFKLFPVWLQTCD